MTGLLERDRELELVGDRVRAAVLGNGSVLVLRGPAGIGKSAVLRAARAAAAGRGLTVLAATSSELDRDFPFGIVHQLMQPLAAERDPQRRREVFTGAARLAEPLLTGADAADEAAGADPGHALLHGLYWVTANLADAAPLALVVEDLHWTDYASLRYLEFLGRRLEGVGVLVLASLRTGEESPGEPVVDALMAGPVAHVVDLAPLSADATAQLVGDATGGGGDAEFVAACHDATGGNPLLIRELARGIAEHGLRGTAQERDRVAALGAAGLAATVQRRLAQLGDAAVAVARAAAVLGDRAERADVAALAGSDGPATRGALDRLVRAGVLDEGGGFSHPLVREAVVQAAPAVELARLHAAAARRRGEAGARPEELAVHLLNAEPDGDPWVADVLEQSAAACVAGGAPADAEAHLRRALAQDVPGGTRARLLLRLGEVLALQTDPEAPAVLDQAIAAGLPAEEAAQARFLIGRSNLLRPPFSGFAELREMADEDPRVAAVLLTASHYDIELLEERRALLAGDGPRWAARVAHMAIEAVFAARPRAEVEALLHEALDGDRLLREVGPEEPTNNVAISAARRAEMPDLAARAIDAHEAEGRRRGSAISRFSVAQSRANSEWFFGSLVSAEALLREALSAARERRLQVAEVSVAGTLVEVLVERDAVDEALALVDGFDWTPEAERTIPAAEFLSARAHVRHLRDRRDAALADLRRAAWLNERRGVRAPLHGRTRLRLAELLAEVGEIDEARALADETLAIARGAGLAGAEGATLRASARVFDDALPRLEAAVEALRRSPLQLELGWALHDLGARLRRDGRRGDAREPLREALDLAGRAGATRLSRLAREELLAAGARPRREALSGPDALTPSERRVAELAAGGLSNREIAETLWVTKKTVEVHLGNAYAKLGIPSRQLLGKALGRE